MKREDEAEESAAPPAATVSDEAEEDAEEPAEEPEPEVDPVEAMVSQSGVYRPPGVRCEPCPSRQIFHTYSR